jgi:hypothetical protein
MADKTKADTAADTKSPVQSLTQSPAPDLAGELEAQISKLKADLDAANKSNAALKKHVSSQQEKLEAYQREAGLMQSALDQARRDAKRMGLPDSALQLAESVTIVSFGKMVDARPGDVLVPEGTDISKFQAELPVGIKAYPVDEATARDCHRRKLVRA